MEERDVKSTPLFFQDIRAQSLTEKGQAPTCSAAETPPCFYPLTSASPNTSPLSPPLHFLNLPLRVDPKFNVHLDCHPFIFLIRATQQAVHAASDRSQHLRWTLDPVEIRMPSIQPRRTKARPRVQTPLQNGNLKMLQSQNPYQVLLERGFSVRDARRISAALKTLRDIRQIVSSTSREKDES